MSDGGGKGVGGTASSRTTTVPNGKSYGEAAVSNGGRTGVTSARARSPKESAAGKGLSFPPRSTSAGLAMPS